MAEALVEGEQGKAEEVLSAWSWAHEAQFGWLVVRSDCLALARLFRRDLL